LAYAYVHLAGQDFGQAALPFCFSDKMLPSPSTKRWLPLLLVAFVMLAPCLAEKKDNSLDWKWHKGRATYYGGVLRCCLAAIGAA
jgi:hypothetical protein